MAKISDITEAKIKAAAKITDVLADQGVVLRRNGANLMGLCPFHEDRTVGSFVVKPSENICSCFACGATGMNPIDTLIRLKFANMSEKEAYPQALRYLAAMYNIIVDDEPVPVVEKKAPITPLPPKQQPIYWTYDLVRPFKAYNEKNPLLQYLLSLPLIEQHKERLKKAIVNYSIGTYPNGYHEGWSIWWYMDHNGYVRTGKLMRYKPDGHRDKSTNATWVHSLLAKAGKYDAEKYKPDMACLFGQHLLEICPKAIIRIVESEKTAVICSAFCDPKQVIWMATGGMQGLNERSLLPILKKGRYVELYPDYDGYPDWEKKVTSSAELSGYMSKGMLVISSQVKDLWKPEDGGKADIADIMIRIVSEANKTEEEKTYDMVCAQLGIAEHEGLRTLINNLQLRIE